MNGTNPLSPSDALVVARPIVSASSASTPPASAPFVLSEISRRAALLDVILILCVPIGMVYLPTLMSRFASADEESAGALRLPGHLVLLTMKWLELLMVVLLAAYLIFRHGLRASAIGLRRGDWPVQFLWGLTALLSAYAYLVGAGLLAVIVTAFFFEPDVSGELNKRIEFASQLPTDDFGITVALLIAVALHEELLFRGLLLTHLRRATGAWWPAVVLSSLVFGGLHYAQGWTAMLMITGLSVVLSTFFIWSRSLFAVALAHFTFDLFQLQIMKLVFENAELLRKLPTNP